MLVELFKGPIEKIFGISSRSLNVMVKCKVLKFNQINYFETNGVEQTKRTITIFA